MQFNTFSFLGFIAIVFPLYCVLSFRWQNRMLLLASYVFYGWVEPRFLGLMLFTTIIDFVIGMKIGDATDARTKKRWLLASIILNLTILGFFKYFDFFMVSVSDAMTAVGLHASPFLLKLALPVGISFYTFHEISYTVDVYREHIKPARKFEDFAVFISFFPQLVAGPIGRASWQMPQFEKPREMTWKGWCEGALLMLIGFFKKVCIADVLSVIVERVYAKPELCSGATLLAATYCFAFQIYADFSGYSDIARGLSKFMGFELIENFNQPYFSASITEFWRRWHISLSTWLRDYLYIPLGGNRHGKFNTYRNLFLTMFLGGLWHGASWKFAVWGSLHGIYLAVHKFLLERKAGVVQAGAKFVEQPKDFWLVKVLKIVGTFHLVLVTWVFFRADTWHDGWVVLSTIFTKYGKHVADGVKVSSGELSSAMGGVAALMLLIDLPQYLKNDHCIILKWPTPIRTLLYAALFIAAIMMRGVENAPFIYFQF